MNQNGKFPSAESSNSLKFESRISGLKEAAANLQQHSALGWQEAFGLLSGVGWAQWAEAHDRELLKPESDRSLCNAASEFIRERRAPLGFKQALQINDVGSVIDGRVTAGERECSPTLPAHESLGSIMARDFGPLVWAIDGLVLEGEPQTILLHGSAGIGKTMAELQLAVCLCVGTTWLGRTVQSTKQKIGLLLTETTRRFLKVRLAKISPDMSPEEWSKRFPLVFCREDRVSLVNDSSVRELAQRCFDLGIGTIVIDPLAQLYPGWDLSGESDAGRVTSDWNLLTTYGGPRHLIVSHHDRKTSVMGRAGTDADQARGSTALVAAADAVIRMAAEGKLIRIAAHKVREGASWTSWVSRDEATGLLCPSAPPINARDARISKLDRVFMVLVEHGQLSKTGVHELLVKQGLQERPDTIGGYLAELVRMRRVLIVGRGPATKYEAILGVPRHPGFVQETSEITGKSLNAGGL